MPMIRKLINLRTSRAVCIPKSWLDFYERETGVKIREVAVEVNKILKIHPILPKMKARKVSEEG